MNVRLTAEGGHVVVAGLDCEGSGGKKMKGYFRSCWPCSRPINVEPTKLNGKNLFLHALAFT